MHLNEKLNLRRRAETFKAWHRYADLVESNDLSASKKKKRFLRGVIGRDESSDNFLKKVFGSKFCNDVLLWIIERFIEHFSNREKWFVVKILSVFHDWVDDRYPVAPVLVLNNETADKLHSLASGSQCRLRSPQENNLPLPTYGRSIIEALFASDKKILEQLRTLHPSQDIFYCYEMHLSDPKVKGRFIVIYAKER